MTTAAKYSPIAPLGLLQQMNAENMLGDYLLVLAHDVLAHKDEYLSLIYSAMGDEGFVILDNSVVELGTAMSPQKLCEAAKIVNADVIVLPDVMGDADATIQAAREAIMEMGGEKYGFMKIVQGSNADELITCIDWMNTHVEGNYWAVPRWITNELGSRVPIVQAIQEVDSEAKIHLLGMSEHIEDDIKCARMTGVIGIDSANPIVLGQMGQRLGQSKYRHMKRGSFWQQKLLTNTTLENIKYMRRAIA